MQPNTKLEDYLGCELGGQAGDADMAQILSCLATSASELAQKISRNSLIEMKNSIELVAFGLFEGRLRDAPISLLISEKFEEPQVQNPDAAFAVVIHPLEAVDNIACAMPFGSIFSIHRLNGRAAVQDFCSGTIVAAGFFVYGPQTQLVLSCGAGVSLFTLDPEAWSFYLTRERIQVPEQQHELAIDVANYRFWDSNIRHYFDDCVAGSDGPLGLDFKLHWNQSLLVEVYRILLGGGVYICPDDTQPGFNSGRHKLLYEALPIAFLMTQAGGKAADGYSAIEEIEVSQVDARVPLIFGAGDAVGQVLEYFSGDPTETTRFPLFDNRSLLRN